jgi:hypothetical protein
MQRPRAIQVMCQQTTQKNAVTAMLTRSSFGSSCLKGGSRPAKFSGSSGPVSISPFLAAARKPTSRLNFGGINTNRIRTGPQAHQWSPHSHPPDNKPTAIDYRTEPQMLGHYYGILYYSIKKHQQPRGAGPDSLVWHGQGGPEEREEI